METVKVNRESVFFHKLLTAIAYSELIEHDNKIYRVFEKIDAIYYFDSLFPELEEEKDPTSELEIVGIQTIEANKVVAPGKIEPIENVGQFLERNLVVNRGLPTNIIKLVAQNENYKTVDEFEVQIIDMPIL